VTSSVSLKCVLCFESLMMVYMASSVFYVNVEMSVVLCDRASTASQATRDSRDRKGRLVAWVNRANQVLQDLRARG
jgi:hypothetical protein